MSLKSKGKEFLNWMLFSVQLSNNYEARIKILLIMQNPGGGNVPPTHFKEANWECFKIKE